MQTRELTCIGCPMGCHITVKWDGDNKENIEVTGNTCNIGYKYAISEVTNPERVVTGTVCVENRVGVVASVKTAAPIPKDRIFEVAEMLKKIKVSAPLSIGDEVPHEATEYPLKIVVTRAVD